MKGNNEMIFCEAQMIEILDHYLRCKMFGDFNFKVESVKSHGGNYGEQFKVVLSEADGAKVLP